MHTRQLGTSDLYVSPLALGCWAFAGGSWGEQSEADSIATIHAALEHGINFLDTAEGYGSGLSEEIVGKALIDRRDQAVLATKISPNHAAPENVRPTLEASLRRLQTDYVDLYIIHWPTLPNPVGETLAVLHELQKEGKIRAIGISNFGKQQLTEVIETGIAVAANQCGYNLLSRGVEFDVLPLGHKNEISLTAYMPLLQGILAGKWANIDEIPPFRTRTRQFNASRGGRHGTAGFEDLTFKALDGIRKIATEIGHPMANVALAWIAAQEGVASVIAGARKPSQIERNVHSMELTLDAETVARLSAATDDLKQAMGPNIDLWQVGENSRSG